MSYVLLSHGLRINHTDISSKTPRPPAVMQGKGIRSQISENLVGMKNPIFQNPYPSGLGMVWWCRGLPLFWIRCFPSNPHLGAPPAPAGLVLVEVSSDRVAHIPDLKKVQIGVSSPPVSEDLPHRKSQNFNRNEEISRF